MSARHQATAGSADATSASSRALLLIEKLIATKTVGDRLPGEAELARELGVSRLTVREAMQNLSARGFILTTRGRTATVAAPGSSGIADFVQGAVRQDPAAYFDLLDVRQMLEIYTARRAAQRVTPGTLVPLEGALRAMGEAGDAEALLDADTSFHVCLAAITGNSVVAGLIEALTVPLRESSFRSFEGHLARGGTAADIVETHAAILDQVRAHDGAGAEAAMRRHLRETRLDLVRALERGEDVG